MRPGWPRKAAIKRMSKVAVDNGRPAGRRNVLIWGRASAKIMGDSFLGGRGRLLLIVTLPTKRTEAKESFSLPPQNQNKGSAQLQNAPAREPSLARRVRVSCFLAGVIGPLRCNWRRRGLRRSGA